MNLEVQKVDSKSFSCSNDLCLNTVDYEVTYSNSERGEQITILTCTEHLQEVMNDVTDDIFEAVA
jgi:hypothetical protein